MVHGKFHLRSGGQARWLLSAVSAMEAAAFMLRLWQAHSVALTLGPFADLRASLWESLAPALAFHGTILALLVWASLSSWAAWRREQRLAP